MAVVILAVAIYDLLGKPWFIFSIELKYQFNSNCVLVSLRLPTKSSISPGWRMSGKWGVQHEHQSSTGRKGPTSQGKMRCGMRPSRVLYEYMSWMKHTYFHPEYLQTTKHGVYQFWLLHVSFISLNSACCKLAWLNWTVVVNTQTLIDDVSCTIPDILGARFTILVNFAGKN